jgi:hypothetical protein
MGARVTVFAAVAKALASRGSTPGRVRIANQVAVEAQADAPVLTGAYRNGIEVQVDGDRVSVVDMDPESIYKEYGTSDTPAHASLTEAAMRHGRYTGWQPRG